MTLPEDMSCSNCGHEGGYHFYGGACSACSCEKFNELMSETQKVFIVEHGSYSDYTVEGIFSTREKAEEFAERYNLTHASMYDEAVVEERELDPEHEVPKLIYVVDVGGAGFQTPQFMPRDEPTYIPTATFVYYARGHWLGQAVGSTPEIALKSIQDAVAQEKARSVDRMIDGIIKEN